MHIINMFIYIHLFRYYKWKMKPLLSQPTKEDRSKIKYAINNTF